MRKEVYICDICGGDIATTEERYAIDAKVRHTTNMNRRGGFLRADMCPKRYAKMVEFCKGTTASVGEGEAK